VSNGCEKEGKEEEEEKEEEVVLEKVMMEDLRSTNRGALETSTPFLPPSLPPSLPPYLSLKCPQPLPLLRRQITRMMPS
jgi:hypothetical protein